MSERLKELLKEMAAFAFICLPLLAAIACVAVVGLFALTVSSLHQEQQAPCVVNPKHPSW